MKTLFVCAAANNNNHIGEGYDEILEVENQPTTETIDMWASKISNIIRRLWSEDTGEKKVVVTLDAATPFNLILQNLQVVMKEQQINVVLPYVIERTTTDPEACEVLRRLENREGV